VAAILRRAVDVEGTGRFILGRWWRTATPAEQQEYLQLFEQTLIRNLASRFGEYRACASPWAARSSAPRTTCW
jgi:phospholipid transport system substrate-binding protein